MASTESESVNPDAGASNPTLCGGCNVRGPWEHRCWYDGKCGCVECGMDLAPYAPMNIVVMKSRSSSGAWQEHSLPAWIDYYSLVEARSKFQIEQAQNKTKLGYCARTAATSWIGKNRPEWEKRLGTGFESLMVAYALCLDAKAIKLRKREYES